MSVRQRTAIDWLLKEQPGLVSALLYGGAKGGGKTVFLCIFAYLYSLMLASEFDLKPQRDLRKVPIIGFLGRKQGTHFSATTLVTWKRFIPADHYQIRMVDGKVPVIVIDNRVALLYGGMDHTETQKKFNSAEIMFAAVDQAEECSEEDVSMIRGALRLQLRNGAGETRAPKKGFKLLLSANPAECWLKSKFVRASTRMQNSFYLQALPTDNPFLPEGYVDNLRETYKFNPALLKAYLEGLWEGLDAAQVIIPRFRIEACVNNELVAKSPMRKLTCVDVAGESEQSDESVIGNFENEKLVSWEIYAHRDLMDTAGRAIAHAAQNGSTCITIDKVGEGSGVFSRVREVMGSEKNESKRVRVYGFDGRVTPPGPATGPKSLAQQTYKNYKSYAWFNASKGVIADRKCSIPNDEQLLSQLSSVTYKYDSSGKLMVTPKDELKDLLGGSPDRADMFIMGLDGLQYCRAEKKRDIWADDSKQTTTYRWSPDSV